MSLLGIVSFVTLVAPIFLIEKHMRLCANDEVSCWMGLIEFVIYMEDFFGGYLSLKREPIHTLRGKDFDLILGFQNRLNLPDFLFATWS